MKVSNLKLAMGIPCNFPQVPLSFFNSFVLMEKPDFQFITADNGPIDTLRNDIVEKALSINVTKLIMMDVDQIYPPLTITKLLAHNLPVVGAMVCRRYPPFDPIIMKLSPEGYVPVDGYEPGSLVECDATGSGCIMYDMEIFKKLPYPWFRFRKNPDNNMTIGEDIGLCQDLRMAGYKIYVDTSIEIGHLTTMVVNRQTHELYKAMKCSQDKKREALGVNDKNII